MKLWDVRDPSKCTTFDAQSEVRDVQFSPFYPYYFASALENGNILIWDMRKQQPERRFAAHTGLIGALAWHPAEKNTLASGGRDRLIKTWDLTAGTKPSSTTQTIAFVGRLNWRPPSHGRPWHIASSAGSSDNSVHLWDTKHPFVPLASLQGSRDVTTSHLWTESNNIIASSKDGIIRIFDLAKHCYLPNRHMAATAIRFNVRNHLALVHEPIDRRANPIALDAPKPDVQSAFASGPGFVPIEANLSPIARFGDFKPPFIQDTHDDSDSTWHNDEEMDHSGEDSNSTHARSKRSHRSRNGSHGLSLLDDAYGLDPAVFQFLAENYKYQGETPVELCRHNASIASLAHQHHLTQMWTMLQMLFTPADDFMDSVYQNHHSATGAPGAHSQAQATSTDEKSIPGGEKAEETFTSTTNSYSIPIEISGPHGNSAGNSGLVSPNAHATGGGGGGSKSTEAFSPVPDDWDLHLLDVPSATAHLHHPHHSQQNHHGSNHASAAPLHYGGQNAGSHLAGKGDRTNPGALRLDFGGAFDYPSGFTEQDFVDDLDNPRTLIRPLLGDEDGGLMGMTDAVLGAGRNVVNAFGSGFLALQAARTIETQQAWDFAPVIHEVLNYYEHHGDVQTCVFVGFVLQEFVAVEPRRTLAWMIAYVDLLHRMQLWNCANSMAKHCHLDSIRNLSKQGTTVYTKCASCNKAILGNAGVYCENCKKATSTCALCRIPVKGSLAWCAGCGHGGHSQHMRQWFSSESACPTGCGHICVLTQLPTPAPSPSPSPTPRKMTPTIVAP